MIRVREVKQALLVAQEQEGKADLQDLLGPEAPEVRLDLLEPLVLLDQQAPLVQMVKEVLKEKEVVKDQEERVAHQDHLVHLVPQEQEEKGVKLDSQDHLDLQVVVAQEVLLVLEVRQAREERQDHQDNQALQDHLVRKRYNVTVTSVLDILVFL